MSKDEEPKYITVPNFGDSDTGRCRFFPQNGVPSYSIKPPGQGELNIGLQSLSLMKSGNFLHQLRGNEGSNEIV